MGFWHGKRVFVTGHTGFKGGWLALWLQRLGADVTGYALDPPTEPSLFASARVADGMHSVIGDINDLASLQQAVARARPEIVLHLAAQPLVRAGYSEPVETYRTNVLGTVHVLEAVRRATGVRAAVIVTTDKCYENREWHWGYREADRLGGFDPYSNSKACAELATSSYRDAFFPADRHGEHGLALATARAGNVIGGGDWGVDRLVPDTVRALTRGQAVRIRRPDAIRPWQHVLDPLAGYLVLAQRLYDGGTRHAGAWNFGPRDEDARPVSWVVERFARAWGADASWELDAGPHPHEAHYLKLDCSKARAELGWSPGLPLEQALEWTAAWYKWHRDGAAMRERCVEQIAAYEAL